MVTTRRCSVISLTVRVFGIATSMPDCSTGAVIMKITSSTSTTSTSGVMLISAREDCVLPLLVVKATANLLRLVARRRGVAHRNLFERVQQFPAEVVGCRCEDADTRGELVVSDNRWNCYKQAGGGGDKRLRDAGGNSTQRCGAGGAKAMKCVDHTHDSAEETDERAGGGDGGEPAEPAFERGYGLAGRGLGGALQRRKLARRAGAASLALVCLVDVDVNLCQRAGLVVVGKGGNFLKASGAAEGIDEVAALSRDLAESRDFAEDDGPRVKAEDEQQEQDAQCDSSNIAHHLHQRAGALRYSAGWSGCASISL